LVPHKAELPGREWPSRKSAARAPRDARAGVKSGEKLH
jgi:hypothetical protein